MVNLEEALRNIDVFCKVLVEKIVENEAKENKNIVEPIEKLFYRKNIIELRPKYPSGYLIPIQALEEPLIDIFEGDNSVKILMHCRCKDQKVVVKTDSNSLEICTEECRRLNLSTKHLQIEKMITKCNKNSVLEIDIPKMETQ